MRDEGIERNRAQLRRDEDNTRLLKKVVQEKLRGKKDGTSDILTTSQTPCL